METLEDIQNRLGHDLEHLSTVEPLWLSYKFEAVRRDLEILQVGELTEEQRHEATLLARGMALLTSALIAAG
jgi:hypothetical protein